MWQRELIRSFKISRASLHHWRLRKAQRTLAPRCSPCGPRKYSPQQEELLWVQLQTHPDATVDEHLRLWHSQHHHSVPPVSRATMGRAILRLNWTRKKSV